MRMSKHITQSWTRCRQLTTWIPTIGHDACLAPPDRRSDASLPVRGPIRRNQPGVARCRKTQKIWPTLQTTVSDLRIAAAGQSIPQTLVGPSLLAKDEDQESAGTVPGGFALTISTSALHRSRATPRSTTRQQGPPRFSPGASRTFSRHWLPRGIRTASRPGTQSSPVPVSRSPAFLSGDRA